MKKDCSIIIMIIGIMAIVIGIVLPLPGAKLTRNSFMKDEKRTYISDYIDDVIWSSDNDELEYIVGSNMVSADINSTKVIKTICVIGGLIIFSMGLLAFAWSIESEKNVQQLDKEQLPQI